jgi:hypothetical protein
MAAPDITLAQSVISNRSGDAHSLFTLAHRLHEDNNTTYARQVLTVAEEVYCDEHDGLWFDIKHKLALYTYKDQDQPLADRLTESENRLKKLLKHSGLSQKMRQDCLGMLGGINKERWRSFGNRAHLEASVSFYSQGVECGGVALDGGYTALNAAFALDALSDMERDDKGKLTPDAQERRARADRLREEILATVPEAPEPNATEEQKWWRYCTIGESHLGLHRYDKAKTTLAKTSNLNIHNWRRESAARQMADLARLHRAHDAADVDEQKAWDAMAPLVDGNVDAARLLVGGKIGLALSGGGFRASLFHIGVLARLAELDVLRHIEVISCVSGGSIVGAYYYLKLQHLLGRKGDSLTRDDYICLVRQMETEFVRGIQRNLRNLMLFGFKSNLKVLTSRQSSMTHRLGDLYESELYAQIEDGRHKKPRLLADLTITPDDNPRFSPRTDNFRRRAKVPILVLNSTTLNTCHNWQFTATFMGEPPTRSINTDINANDRLRRMYHSEAPLPHRKTMRLGHSVAASACVPGLFDPLMIDGLYEGGYVTRLVDGGVYDNQGLASLLEQNCTVLLISDASGQTGREFEPADTRLGVMTRTQDVLMARVREAQYELLNTLASSSLLRGFMYLHLKLDLSPQQIDWHRCPNPTPRPRTDPCTSYGIRRDVQERLAALRTDLDAFSDIEADALMLSGYKMAEEQFSKVGSVPVSSAGKVRWRFQGIEPIVCARGDVEHLSDVLRALEVGSRLAFKPFFLSRTLLGITAVLLFGVLSLLGYWAWTAETEPLVVTLERSHAMGLLLGLVALTIVGAAGRWVARKARYRNRPQRVLFAVWACGLFGWAVMRLYSFLTQPFFVNAGGVYQRDDYSEQELEPAKAGTGPAQG